MARDSFVHLHLHTEYSLLDGAIRMKELMKKAVEFKMPAVAITDHGNLFGASEFYQEAQRSGVKPIIGCEAYIAPGSNKDRPGSRRDSAYHFTLLSKNEAGYRNLVKLVTAAHLEGFHYAPRIDKELLATHSEGLIGLSGCLAGEINSAIQRTTSRRRNRARPIIGTFSARRISSSNCTITGWRNSANAWQRCRKLPGILASDWSRLMMFTFCAGAIIRRTTSCFASVQGKWCRTKTGCVTCPSCISNHRPRCASCSVIFPKQLRTLWKLASVVTSISSLGAPSIRST